MDLKPQSARDRLSTRADAARKQQAFAALLVARIAFLAVAFMVTALALWGAVVFSRIGSGGLTFVLLVPLSLAAMSFLSSYYVVRQPRAWAIVQAVQWCLPVLGVLAGARLSPVAFAAIAGSTVGCIAIFRARDTLGEHGYGACGGFADGGGAQGLGPAHAADRPPRGARGAGGRGSRRVVVRPGGV